MQKNISQLKFIHIPKTAGSSIELVGAQNGIKWGERDAGVLSRHQPTCGKNVSIRHIPLNCFKLGNPYKDYNVFAVVRNPMTKIISAYNFLNRSKKNERNAQHLNIWIKESFEKYKDDPHVHTNMILPQHKFIYYEEPDCKVHHILRFENIKQEFENLTKQYGKPLTLSDHHRVFTSNSGLSRKDLNKDTIEMIKDFYRKDFELWYPEELK